MNPDLFLLGIIIIIPHGIIIIFHGIPYGLITGIAMERILNTPILGQENVNREKSST